jgi:hypothetical protein
MSRLEFHIEQKLAQRDGIDQAAAALAGRVGVVLEIGLGKGRSYSHLVARFPGCEILCFDRRDHTHPGWGPPPGRLVLGELRETLRAPALGTRLAGRVILAHLDLARGDSPDVALHALVVETIAPWLQPGAWVLSDRPLPLVPDWRLEPVAPIPATAHAHRFHRYVRPEA